MNPTPTILLLISDIFFQNADYCTLMILTSPAFINQASIPQKYTCQGEGINPPLEISEVPENAKTLILIVDDPDAPAGEFVHWVMWHIDPGTKIIEENSIPQGAMEGMNSASELGWIAPCPPEDTGNIIIVLYFLHFQKILIWKKGLHGMMYIKLWRIM